MDKKALIVASGNRNKIEEIKSIMNLLDWDIRGAGEFDGFVLPEETGTSYEENAFIKAKACVDSLKLPSLADDSGLEVDILDGAPGVISSKYGGIEGDSKRNIEKLLGELEGVPWEKRKARFVCCALLILPDGYTHTEWGIVEGYVNFAPVGEKGFGYDPIFVPNGYHKTFAQFEQSEKNKISHRGLAFKKMAEFIRSITYGNSSL
ncbi:MAG: RdgB/HAM1 family non-canonical purine NTP pyrophosphatase [Candidatus Hydrogenedentes bacterium]|nr:RdgB/HAM1 family non-canonical purine NTP pyrophosphatase [Candidatus Hydrogenedentota bacterium]